MAAAMAAITLPEAPDMVWVKGVQAVLDAATRDISSVKQVLPQAVAIRLFQRCEELLKAEPPLIEASDFVDRGAWGLETLVLLACLKLALPQQVFLLRGNHETATCTLMYGFKQELVAKYGKKVWRPLYVACKRLFAALPLGALVGGATLVLHGGLFRAPPQRITGKNKRKRTQPLFNGADTTLGSLDDLRKAFKGGLDPNGMGQSRLATDVLWSDPVMEPGLRLNEARGVGLVFGPDVTERFLKANNLRLVLRSHEGPDAREGRDDMQHMLEGWTLDHETESGQLMTVFSAPDYPQFIPEEAERYRNKAAVAVLRAPDYATPDMRTFEAVHPRPTASPFYDLLVPDSDEEYEPAPSTASGMTDVRQERTEQAGGGEGAVDGPADAAAPAAPVLDEGEGAQKAQQGSSDAVSEPPGDGLAGAAAAAKAPAPAPAAKPAAHRAPAASQKKGRGGGKVKDAAKLPRPEGMLPCPRPGCGSMETKFCYYNNYSVNQVAPGAGKRRTSSSTSRSQLAGPVAHATQPTQSQQSQQSQQPTQPTQGEAATQQAAGALRQHEAAAAAGAAPAADPLAAAGALPGLGMFPGMLQPPLGGMMPQAPLPGMFPGMMMPGMPGMPGMPPLMPFPMMHPGAGAVPVPGSQPMPAPLMPGGFMMPAMPFPQAGFGLDPAAAAAAPMVPDGTTSVLMHAPTAPAAGPPPGAQAPARPGGEAKPAVLQPAAATEDGSAEDGRRVRLKASREPDQTCAAQQPDSQLVGGPVPVAGPDGSVPVPEAWLASSQQAAAAMQVQVAAAAAAGLAPPPYMWPYGWPGLGPYGSFPSGPMPLGGMPVPGPRPGMPGGVGSLLAPPGTVPQGPPAEPFPPQLLHQPQPLQPGTQVPVAPFPAAPLPGL
eukprot:scaffold18.g1912.t1